MSEPVSSLDPRFSDPDAEPTSWHEAVEILRSAQLAWLTTVRSDGRPHVTPLVAVWYSGACYFSTGPTEQKAVNLRHNPAVVITTGCNDWDDGLDVVVEGNAQRVTDRSTLEQLVTEWAAKWDPPKCWRSANGRSPTPDTSRPIDPALHRRQCEPPVRACR